MVLPDSKLTRIGVFYDGGFFSIVSDYYAYYHPRRTRLSIDGIHRFAIHKVAEMENVDERYCQVVDAHYFRGRFSARDADQRGKLLAERQFEDVLMREGVVTHYLPQFPGKQEKGIDVWLALEAFELAVYKRFSVLVLIAGDGDYLALVRKLNTLGTRVMLLGWDFQYVDQNGQPRVTRTAQALLDEVTYPILMNTEIEDRTARNDPIIRDLFLQPKPQEPAPLPPALLAPERVQTTAVSAPSGTTPADEPTTQMTTSAEIGTRRTGKVKAIKDGYGFIADDESGQPDWFFHYSAVLDYRFNELKVGDMVVFEIGEGEKGLLAKQVKEKSWGE